MIKLYVQDISWYTYVVGKTLIKMHMLCVSLKLVWQGLLLLFKFYIAVTILLIELKYELMLYELRAQYTSFTNFVCI